MLGKSIRHRNICKRELVAVLFALFSSLFLGGCGAVNTVEAELSSLESSETAEEMTEPSEERAETEFPSEIYVYVCGAVENAGVYKLPQGSRVFEAVEKAGGLGKEAAEDALNQASLLSDGDEIRIPTKKEAEEAKKVLNAGENGGQRAAGGLAEAEDGRVNINTASASELTEISGIGKTRAEAIVSYRESEGAFAAIEDIKKVPGIKDGLFSKIKDKIRT